MIGEYFTGIYLALVFFTSEMKLSTNFGTSPKDQTITKLLVPSFVLDKWRLRKNWI